MERISKYISLCKDNSKRKAVIKIIFAFGIAFVLMIIAVSIMVIIGDNNKVFEQNYSWSKPLFTIGSILLFSMIIFFLIEALVKKPPYSKKFFLIVTAIFSGLIILLTFIWIGIWPFGNKTFMALDAGCQYTPMLSWLRNNLIGNGEGGFLYSFQSGLGISTLPMIGYYLASPLNILLVLFPMESIPDIFTLLILIKSVIASVAFAVLVQYISEKTSWIAPIVGILYSTSMFLVVYSWNIMWLDVIMLLPLIIMSFERMFRENKCLLYIFFLAYAIFSNFYMAYMVCIFLVLYFVAFCIREKITGNILVKYILRFSIGSLLAFGLSAILFIPTFLGLQDTSAVSDTINFGEAISPLDLSTRFLFSINPDQAENHSANVACGILSIISVPLFIINKHINIRERIAYFALWLIMAVSINLKALQFIWSGFHWPNGMPFRYAYILIFCTLFMLYKVLLNFHGLTIKQIVFSGLLSIIFIFFLQKIKTEELSFTHIYGTLIWILIYMLIFTIGRKYNIKLNTICLAFLFVIVAEVILSNNDTHLQFSKWFGSHDTFLVTENSVNLEKTIQATVKEADQDDDQFYRINNGNRKTFLDGFLYNYKDISTYSSSYPYSITKTMMNLGCSSYGEKNSFYLNSFIPTIESLCGVKYYISEADMSNNPFLEKIDTIKSGSSEKSIYLSVNSLPLGYVGTENIKNYKSTKYDPIKSQEDLYASLTNSGKLWRSFALTSNDENITLTEKETGTYFSIKDIGTKKTTEITVNIDVSGEIYAYADCSVAEKIEIKGGKYGNGSIKSNFTDMGKMDVGDRLTITIDSKNAVSGNIYVATINEEILSKDCKELQNNSLNVSEMKGNYVSGMLKSDKNGVVCCSIPYDSGWSVYVDENKVETFKIDDSLLAFDITNGEHKVEMKFWPRGLTIGILVSLFSVVLILFLLEYRHRKKNGVLI